MRNHCHENIKRYITVFHSETHSHTKTYPDKGEMESGLDTGLTSAVRRQQATPGHRVQGRGQRLWPVSSVLTENPNSKLFVEKRIMANICAFFECCRRPGGSLSQHLTSSRQAAAELALCIPCAVGTFSNQPGVSSCKRCPKGTKRR